MKLKKLLSGFAASFIAIGALSVNSSADIYVSNSTDKSSHLTTSANRWMILIQNGDNTANCGIDITQIRTVDFYTEIVVSPDLENELTLDEYDYGKDWFGGAIVFSEGGDKFKEVYGSEVANKYNWNSADWGGVPAPGDGPGKDNQGTAEYDKSVVMEYLNDFSYKISRTMKDDEVFLETPPDYCQISLEEWGHNSDFNLKVDLFVFRDNDGNIILAYDSLGNKISVEDAQAQAAEYETPKNPDPTGDKTEASEAETQPPADSSVSSNDGINGTTDAAVSGSSLSSANSASKNVTIDNSGLILGIAACIAAVLNVIVIIIVLKKK